jgi:L-lactate dehydrogenase complex protein LldE
MFNAGYFCQSREVARYFLKVFGDTDALIVAPSSSCAAMVRTHYLKLFEDEPVWLEKARQVSSRTYEFCEFLVKKLNVDLAKFNVRFDDSVTFHRSCHYRELNITDEPVSLIRQISGIKYIPLENIEQCCGFGGTFSVKFPHISETMVREKLESIRRTNARWLIFGDAGCAMNITGYANRIGQPIRAMHIAELIDKSMGS